MQIRNATGAEMLALWGYQEYNTASPTAKFFYDNITSGNSTFWALDNEGFIVGELYAFFDLDDKDFADGQNTAYLCAFRVKKEFRGQGNGSRLMETALAKLKEMGFRHATIGVESDEPQNLRMYRRFGFCSKVKDCHYDPCSMDINMTPQYENTVWWLLRKYL